MEDLPSRADHTLTLGADHEILTRELTKVGAGPGASPTDPSARTCAWTSAER